MDKITKRYLIPLGILIIGSFVIQLIANYIPVMNQSSIILVMIIIMLFSFGLSLNQQKAQFKRFEIRHIVIVVVLVLLYFYDSGIVSNQVFDWFNRNVIIRESIVKIMYVYCGWLFAEK